MHFFVFMYACLYLCLHTCMFCRSSAPRDQMAMGRLSAERDPPHRRCTRAWHAYIFWHARMNAIMCVCMWMYECNYECVPVNLLGSPTLQVYTGITYLIFFHACLHECFHMHTCTFVCVHVNICMDYQCKSRWFVNLCKIHMGITICHTKQQRHLARERN